MMTTRISHSVWILLLLALLGGLLYVNTLQVPFVFDDVSRIVENSKIHLTELRWETLSTILSPGHMKRPVAFLSFALNYYGHQEQVVGYHLVNIIIHILVGVLIYHLLFLTINRVEVQKSEFFQSSPGGQSLLIGLTTVLWFVHPVQTNAVTYIVQRMTSLATLWYLLSLITYIHGRLLHTSSIRWLWFALCCVSGCLAIGSKQVAATLPIFVLFYEWYFFQDLSFRWLKKRLPYFLGGGVLFGVIALLYLGTNPWNRIMADYPHMPFTLAERIMTEWRVLIYYLSLLLFPHPSRLNLDYDYPLSHGLLEPVTTLAALGLILLLLGLAIVFAKKERVLSFCILWYFGQLAIESTVIGLEIIYEHRLYLPSIFCLFGFMLLLFRLSIPRQFLVGGVCVVCLVFGWWTVQRNRVWQSGVTLFEDVVSKSPDKGRPYWNLGYFYEKHGRFEEAITAYEKAIDIRPYYARAHERLGYILLQQQRYEEAYEQFSRVLDSVDWAITHNNIAVTLTHLGRYDEALTHYRKAVHLEPDFAKAHNGVGTVLAKQGQVAAALRHFRDALKRDPQFAQARVNLAHGLKALGQYEEAEQQYREVLRIEPGRTDVKRALQELLTLQGEPNPAASSPSIVSLPPGESAEQHYKQGVELMQTRKVSQALQEFTETLRLDPKYVDAHNAIALLLAEQGETDQALEHLSEALRVDPNNANTYINIGVFWGGQGAMDKAIVAFEKAIDLNPRSADGHFNLALALYKQGSLKDAQTHAQETLRLQPQHKNAGILLQHIAAARKTQ